MKNGSGHSAVSLMPAIGRLQYYRRILAAYLGPGASQLSFWHDVPLLNPNAQAGRLGEYYMAFIQKAGYRGPHDASGIPMLDYHGRIGLQYNPIAIAQWGLGNYDLFQRTGRPDCEEKFLKAADWLCHHLEQNLFGVSVWNHHFDWEYRELLKAPWYSALAQGQGISLLLRAHADTGKAHYREAADQAFESFLKPTEQGGVAYSDEAGDLWFEEYIVSPPTHILNGLLWALWGVYDYSLATGSEAAEDCFARGLRTLRANLDRYDYGFWSLYELSGTRLPMVASPFYHQLHIVQLRVMHRLTGDDFFAKNADRWAGYAQNRIKRSRAFCYKTAFKIFYY